MELFQTRGTVFFVGIKGAAMANLAVILQKMGLKVTGSDTAEEFITDALLERNSIHVFTSFEPEVLPTDTSVIVYSAAHGGLNNKQLLEGKKRNFQIVHQSELISRIMSQFSETIAVCGTHGKTTTSACLAYTLSKLGARPSYLVGTSDFSGMPGGDYNSKPYFVVEADEYAIDPPHDKRPKLELLEPKYVIATNIDFDHPDVYKDLNDTVNTFDRFFRKVVDRGEPGKLFLCADDPRIVHLALQYPKKIYETFGFGANADLHIKDVSITVETTTFSLEYKGKDIGLFSIRLFGGGHVQNVAGVVLALLNLGFSSDEIRIAIADFTGAKRRFEYVGMKNDTYLFDDYAHHPSEISATVATARARFPGRRIVLIFQPHTFSRTVSLQKEFVSVFQSADLVFLAPIFASAREQAQPGSMSSELLAAEAGDHVKVFQNKASLGALLKQHIKKGDVIFTMGAGDVYKLKDDILIALETSKV